DLTRISAVIRGELIEFPIASDSGEHISVQVPSRNLQLLFKAEAFLRRPFLRARDAFDIKLLQDSGAVLSDSLKVHLFDGPAAEKLENPGFIADRIAQVNSRTCTPELQPYVGGDGAAQQSSSSGSDCPQMRNITRWVSLQQESLALAQTCHSTPTFNLF